MAGSLFTSGERSARRIGDYVVRGLLGQGAMGRVYLVDAPDGTQHALKVLPSEMATDEESLVRFAREVEALMILTGHRGIVQVRGAGRTAQGVPYYVMEYVEGMTLREALKLGLSRDRALDAIERVADALSYAHARNLLHRDLKPENIMIDPQGEARLTDFGLARAIRQVADARLTVAGQSLGTPAFMAPEQAMSLEDQIGPWTDVWGLGTVTYLALTGRTPYEGGSPIEIFTKLHEGAPFPSPRDLDPSIPPALDAAVMGALVTDPARRTPSADDFRVALRAARRVGEGRRGGGAALKVLVALALLSAVIGGGAVAYAVTQRPGPTPPDLDAIAAVIERGGLDDAAALLAKVEPGEDAQLAARVGELQGRIEKARAALRKRVEEVQAVFAQGMVKEAAALLTAGLPEFPELPWILALTGDYAGALAHAGGAPAPERARLAAWAGDAKACEAALGAVTDDARRAALAWELRAFVPALAAPPPPATGGGWGAVARAEAALAQGAPALAAHALAVADEGAPGLRFALRLARARVSVACGELRAAEAELQAATALEELTPLDRGRGLGWRAWLARLLDGAAGPRELEGYAPGVPQALRAVGRPSPWFGQLWAARAAERLGDAEERGRLLALAGAPPALTQGSFTRAEQWLAATGRAGAIGLLWTRARALIGAGAEGGSGEQVAAGLRLLEGVARVESGSPACALAQAQALRALDRPAAAAAAEARALAPLDRELALEEARALARTEEDARLEGRVARWAQRDDPPPAHDDGVAAYARLITALVEADVRGELLTAAQVGIARLLVQRVHVARGQGQELARLQGQLRRELGAVLGELDPGPILAARTALGRSLLAGDRQAARAAAAQLGALARKVTPAQLEALRLASEVGDAPARERGLAFLGLVGDLPAWAALEVEQGDARAAARLSDLPPFALAAELAPNRGAPGAGVGASGASLLRLARVVQAAPEEALFVVLLLEGALDPAQVEPLARELEREPDRAIRALAQALLHTALARRGERASVEAASRAASEACALAPGSPGAHLVAALALTELGRRGERFARELRPHLRLHLDVARAALPWAAAPLLVELAVPGEEPAPGVIDGLLALGFVTRADGLLATPQAERVRARLRELQPELGQLELRRDDPATIGLSGYKLAVKAWRVGLRWVPLALRLRTGMDVAFDSVGQFEDSLEHVITGEHAAPLRESALRDFHLGRVVQVWGDPDLRELESKERAPAMKARRAPWSAKAAAAALRAQRGLEPAGERGRLSPLCTRLVGPFRWPALLAEAARAADAAAHPGAAALWEARLRLDDPAARERALGAAVEHAGEAAQMLSTSDLAQPCSPSQSLLWGAQRADRIGQVASLLAAGEAEEAALCLLRCAAFQRGSTATEVAYWQLSGMRWAEAETVARAKGMLGLARAARLLGGAQSERLFRGVEGDYLVDLARFSAEGSAERKALLAEAREACLAPDPDQVPDHLESKATTRWRRLRALALSGDVEQAKRLYEEVRKLFFKGEAWGLPVDGDPLLPELRKLLPAFDDDRKKVDAGRSMWGRGERDEREEQRRGPRRRGWWGGGDRDRDHHHDGD
ncbi:MAG: protein kinase [Planctomycetota bacterium]